MHIILRIDNTAHRPFSRITSITFCLGKHTMSILFSQSTSMMLSLMFITLVNASKHPITPLHLGNIIPFLTPAERPELAHVSTSLANQYVSAQQLMGSSMRNLRSFLTPSDISSLSATNNVIHQYMSQQTKDEADYLTMEVVKTFGYTTEDKKKEREELTNQMKELTKQTEEEDLLQWRHRVQKIHRMFVECLKGFNIKKNTLTKKENETFNKWLIRVEAIHQSRKSLEKEALTALYVDTNGYSWKNKTNWKPHKDICTWYGVTCTEGSVTALDLSNNQLSGSIPKEIGQLTSLKYLGLNDNNLSGTIPKEIGQLSNLNLLDLSFNNNIYGSIPSEIGKLTNLNFLRLGHNGLTSSIPSEICQLTKLEELSLTYNYLSGSIPKEIGQLKKLKKLKLYNNKLTDTIPTEIGQLKNLEELSLYRNKLAGLIPKEIGQLTNLKCLQLGDNQLSGPIPTVKFKRNWSTKKSFEIEIVWKQPR
eukprot:GSMAST32.ASY1.ANO1.2120.1 assembled CDS